MNPLLGEIVALDDKFGIYFDDGFVDFFVDLDHFVLLGHSNTRHAGEPKACAY